MFERQNSAGLARRLVSLSALLLVLFGFASASRAADAPDTTPVDPPAARIPGEVLVRFTAVSTDSERGQTLDAAGADGAEAIVGIPRARRVALETGQTINDALETLRGRDDVAWAQPNLLGQISAIPNDPLFDQVWAGSNSGQSVNGDTGTSGADIGALPAWDQATGGNTKVAVVDTGIDPTSPDIAPNLNTSLSRNFVAPVTTGGVDSSNWGDENGHGTHVAGTIAAAGNNGIGVTGVNWKADLIAVRACGFDGYCDSASVASALAYAGGTGARAVNVSLGFTGTAQDSSAMRSAIAAHPDTLYVAAAGNESADNDTTPSWPCNLDLANVVCVAATDQNDQLADFSNFGKTNVDLGAPGVNIVSTVPNIVNRFDPDLPDGLNGWSQSPSNSWQMTVTPGGFNAISYTGSGSTSSVVTPAMDFSTGSSCSSLYNLKATFRSGQSFTEEVSVDNGLTWQNPGPFDAIDSSTDLPQNEFTDLGAWLGDAADGNSQVKVRFHLSYGPGASATPPTIQIVQPTVSCIEAQPEGGTYAYYSGTSMAAPETTGAATLLFSHRPDLTVAQARESLLSSVDPLPALNNRTVTGGRLDLNATLTYSEKFAPARASNSFSIVGITRLSNGQAILNVKVAGAGKLSVYGSSRVIGMSRSASAAGTLKLRVRARGSALKKLKKKRSVKVRVNLGYLPIGGSLSQRHRSVRLVRGRF